MSAKTPTNENGIRDFWQTANIFEKSIAQNINKPPYMLYDGPPFATGLPHHGHLLTLTIKDIVQRYFSLNGYNVDRRPGWDCHGLPIEHEINKQLNMQADEAVKSLGVAGYNKECRDIVMRYREEWQSTIAKLGRWVDFDHDYKTMDKNYMESVWWAFHQIWEKGLIYQGTKVMPFSTALQTPLSNFEAGSNYQSVQDPSITVLFPIKDQEAFLAVWTTTPWTLPANQAIAINPQFNYLCVQHPDCNHPIWISEHHLAILFKDQTPTVLDTKPGSELTGWSYTPLFDVPGVQSHWYQVLAADFVDQETGTGLVHLAPAFGEDDNQICKEHGITELICPIDYQGHYTDLVPQYTGLTFKEADKAIIKDLKAQNRLLKHETIVHSYPYCPRSDTPLVYMAVPSWFLSVTKIKSKIIACNERTNWVPEHIKNGRFGKWLENAKDWAVSRNRVWGTPIPIWVNDQTQKHICIDSIATLQKYTNADIQDLHREHIDPLTFQIPGEPGTYRRVSEVLDCWFESGAMPYAKMHYPFENKSQFEQAFPAKCIAEGLDQTRGWFYTLMVLSTALFDKPAFENVIVSGIVMAEDGKKMSKRLRNYTAPDELIELYGADALRLYLISSNLVKGEEMRFSNDGVKQMNRSTFIPLINALKFFQTYAGIDNYQHLNSATASSVPLDQWIISRLQSLKQLIEKSMSAYQLYLIAPQVLKFVDELTNTYIRMNRGRFWGQENDSDKHFAYATLYTVLFEISHIMAPFSPYIAEHLFQTLKPYHPSPLPESVHLTTYPTADETLIDKGLEDAVSYMQDIINMGRAKRVEKNIRVKTPLSEILIIHPDASMRESLARFADKIQSELNIKEISFSNDESKYVELTAKPNLPLVGKRLGKKLPLIRQAILKLSTDEIKRYEKNGSIQVDSETFKAPELIVERHSKSNMDALSNTNITVVINTQLNEALLNEGLARELVSQIQKTRKEEALKVEQRIKIQIHGSQQLRQIFDSHQKYILNEVLAIEYLIADKPQTYMFDEVEGSFSIQIV